MCVHRQSIQERKEVSGSVWHYTHMHTSTDVVNASFTSFIRLQAPRLLILHSFPYITKSGCAASFKNNTSAAGFTV